MMRVMFRRVLATDRLHQEGAILRISNTLFSEMRYIPQLTRIIISLYNIDGNVDIKAGDLI